MSDWKLNDSKTRWMKPRTFSKMQWRVNAYNSWCSAKLLELNDGQNVSEIADLNNLASVTKKSLCDSLCKFVHEVMKIRDGSYYPGKMLYEMIMSSEVFASE